MVALDYQSADAALALGVVPVAIGEVGYVDGGLQPWTAEALGSRRPELLKTASGLPLERIAAARPDLIVTGFNVPDVDAAHGKLSGLAPTISYARPGGTDTWQETTMRVGRALGREDRARRVVADAEARLRAAARTHPEFDGRSITLFNVTPDGIAIVRDDDVSMAFLRQLGYSGITRTVGALPATFGQRARLSPERYPDLEADVVAATASVDPEELRTLRRSPLFSRIPAVEDGRFVELDVPTATSVAFPSALSTRYAVRRFVPALVHAARAAGR